MPILTPRLKAAFQSFLDYPARQRAAQTIATLDDHILKDIGIGSRFPYLFIDTFRH